VAFREFGRFLATAAVLVLVARPAAGQAFIPDAGTGTVSVSFQSVHTEPQLDVNGVKGFYPDGSSDTTDAQAFIWHVEYGLTKKIAVHASLPLIMARYEGLNPHLQGFDGQPSNLDDGAYHGAFQDFYFGIRYALVESPSIAVTPFVEIVIPSHRYETLAQSAVGRDLRMLLVGSALGGFLDDLLPGLYYQTRISYGFSQKVVDLRANRTGLDSAIGYFVNPRFALQFLQTLQYNHDGLYFIFDAAPGELPVGRSGGRPLTFEEFVKNHDRLLRSRIVTLGGGATYAVNNSVGLFATVTTMAWGRSLQQPVRSLTVGLNWGFQTPRSSSRP
jgi:hypothetical protein